MLLAILIDGCAVAGWVVLSQEQQQEDKQEQEEVHQVEQKAEQKPEQKESQVDFNYEAEKLIHNLEERLEAFLETQSKVEQARQVRRVLPETPDPELKADNQIVESVKETVTTKETETEETVSTKTKTKLMVVERDMLDRITGGEHGSLFTIRGLMKGENIGYLKAKQIIDSLSDNGLLFDTGKGFKLVQVDDSQQSLSYN